MELKYPPIIASVPIVSGMPDFLPSATMSAILGTIAADSPMPKITIDTITDFIVAGPMLKHEAGPINAYDKAIIKLPKTIVAFGEYRSLVVVVKEFQLLI